MKTVITLLTFLIGMSIGSISYSESIADSADDQTILDKHIKTAPTPTPVISIVEDEIDYSFFDFDDGC